MLKKRSLDAVWVYSGLVFLRLFSYAIMLSTHQVFLRQSGLGYGPISFLSAVPYIAIVLFEIPTGAYADLFGRRNSYLLSCALPLVSQLLYYYWRHPVIFVLAEIIAGIGFTLASGALEAWAVDTFSAKHNGSNTKRLFYTAEIAGNTANVLGAIVGGYVASLDLGLPKLFCAAGLGATFVFSAVFMTEQKFDHSIREERLSIWRQSGVACNHVFANGRLLRLLILSFVFTTIGSILMPWQALLALRSAELEPAHYGWITGALFVATLIGSLLVSRSKLTLNREFVLAGLLSVLSILVIGLSAVKGTFSLLACLFSIRVIRGYYRPIYSVFFNEQVPDNLRATILSLRSVTDNVATIVILLLSGWLAQVTSPTTGVGFVGIVVFAYAAYQFMKTLRGKSGIIQSSEKL